MEEINSVKGISFLKYGTLIGVALSANSSVHSRIAAHSSLNCMYVFELISKTFLYRIKPSLAAHCPKKTCPVVGRYNLYIPRNIHQHLSKPNTTNPKNRSSIIINSPPFSKLINNLVNNLFSRSQNN